MNTSKRILAVIVAISASCNSPKSECAAIDDPQECVERGCELVDAAVRKWTQTAAGECTDLSEPVAMCADAAGVEDSGHTRYFARIDTGIRIVATTDREGLVGWEPCEATDGLCECPTTEYCSAAADRASCMNAGCTQFYEGTGWLLSDDGVCTEIELRECLLNEQHIVEHGDLVTKYRRPASGGGWEVMVLGTDIGALAGWSQCVDECPCPEQLVDP